MMFTTALRATLLIILIGYVAANKQPNDELIVTPAKYNDSTVLSEEEKCTQAGGVLIGTTCALIKIEFEIATPATDVKQFIPEKAIIIPSAKYEENSDNGFKPLSKSENHRVQSICGTAEESYARIRNGYTGRPKQFPWIVDFGHCTGALISPRHVLTATHCFTDENVCSPSVVDERIRRLKIRYGGNCRSKSKVCPHGSNMKTVAVDRVLYLYGGATNATNCLTDHDVALVLLQEDVEFNDYVRPICFSSKLQPDKLVQIKNVGFGDVNNNRKATSIVRYMESKFVYMPASREVLTSGVKNPYGIPDGCVGDSGGPMQATFEGSNRTYLAGSHGGGCADDGEGLIWSSYVPAYADWLCKFIGVCELE